MVNLAVMRPSEVSINTAQKFAVVTTVKAQKPRRRNIRTFYQHSGSMDLAEAKLSQGLLTHGRQHVVNLAVMRPSEVSINTAQKFVVVTRTVKAQKPRRRNIRTFYQHSGSMDLAEAKFRSRKCRLPQARGQRGAPGFSGFFGTVAAC